jgi:DNA-binding transcriptional regulator YdaS (Cro superfamily)
MTDTTTGIELAVARAGGRRALAADLDVTEQAVGQWVMRGWVPPSRAPEIEKRYKVPRRSLLKPSLVAILYPN